MSKRFSYSSIAIAIWAALFAALLLISATAALAAPHKGKPGKQGATGNGIPDDNDDNKHPSGKDRENNNGQEDDEQGHSSSNPDNDGHGPERNSCPGSGPGQCVDKPGGSGGVDRDDQDGNNGCGNDDDFEDDNEGWCGKPDHAGKGKGHQGQGHEGNNQSGNNQSGNNQSGNNQSGNNQSGNNQSGNGGNEDTEVLGETISRPGGPDVGGVGLAGGPSAAQGRVLPFTGSQVATFALVAIGLIGSGMVLLLTARRRPHS